MRHPFLRTLAGSGVTTDPNFENVTLLLHGDGTNGGQNNSFVDGSTNNFTITRNGNTTQGTFSPYGDNWSNFFDGTGDSLSVATNTAFDFGTGDFTVECWVYQTKYNSGFYQPIFANAYLFYIGETGDVLYFNGSTNVVAGTAGDVPINSWNHLAIVRSGSGTNNTKIYVNGTQKAQGTVTASIGSANPNRIGQFSTVYFPGYISNLRVLKGTAQYTAAFTPPTAPLTAITNTSLLTCQSNRFRDSSTNNFTITRNGDVSVQRFSPFSPTAAYAAGTIGGSGYFDGTDDYLSAADSANLRPGAGAFTIEAWIYRNATGAAHTIYAKGGASTGIVFQVTSGNVLRFTHTTTNIDSTGTIRGSSWNHVAVVREGTGTNQTKLYINGVQDGQGTVSTDFTQTEEVRVGTNRGATEDLNGYLSDVRFVKGTAVYTATFTPPSSPLSAITDTQFLCVFTNASILDNAMMAVPETVGNAQIDTTTKKYGTGSLEFDGNGDYLILPLSESYRLGTGNFTIELWVYFNALTGYQCLLDMRNGTGAAVGVVLYTNGDSSPNVLRFFTVGANRIATSALSTGQWYHVALTRSGTSTKLFINGTQAGSTYTDSNDYIINSPRISIFSDAASGYVNGFIDDLRITKGVARYTANFTAPTAAFPDL